MSKEKALVDRRASEKPGCHTGLTGQCGIEEKILEERGGSVQGGLRLARYLVMILVCKICLLAVILVG